MSTKKIALVTGGSRGLGRNMAIQLASKGRAVVVTYNRNSAEAESVVAEIKSLGQQATALQLDVSNSKTFPAFRESLQQCLRQEFKSEKFNYLINNAGIGIHASFAETTEDQFDELVKVHFKGNFFLTQQLLPLLADGGSIVNISSGLARFSFPGYAAYAAMKGGIEVLTRYQSKELGQRGIRANTVAPGAIETDFGGGAVRDNAQLNGMIAGLTSLGRVGLPDDIGGAVAFLCSEEANWINGQRIEISGGIFL